MLCKDSKKSIYEKEEEFLILQKKWQKIKIPNPFKVSHTNGFHSFIKVL